MKKIIILLLVLLIPAGFAYSATLSDGTASGPGLEIRDTDSSGALIGKLSAGVRVAFQHDANAYAIETAHDKGRKIYATASGDTKIYSQAKNADGAFTPALSDSGITQFDTGWTEL